MLQKIEKLPPKLQAVLAENKPDFVIRGGRSRMWTLLKLIWSFVEIRSVLFVSFSTILYIYGKNYSLSESSIWYHIFIWGLIIFLVMMLLGAYDIFKYHSQRIEDNFCHLFCKPPYFASTYQYFIIYFRGEITMIHWRHFNPSFLIKHLKNTRGDLVLRLYYKEKMIDEYTKEELFDLDKITLFQIEDVEKIAQMCRKRIDQFDSFE